MKSPPNSLLALVLVLTSAACALAQERQPASERSGSFNARDYGAKCDDQANDAAAIQAAIDAAHGYAIRSGHGRGAVYIAAGFCRFGTTIRQRENVSVYGAGKNATYLKYTGRGVAWVISAADTDSWNSLRDVALDGLGSGTHGIRISRARLVELAGVYVTRFTTAGVHITGGGTAATPSIAVWIHHSAIWNNLGDGILSDNDNNNDIRIENNRVGASGGTNIRHTGGQALSWTIRGNTLEGQVGAQGPAIRARSALGWIIDGNYFESQTGRPLIYFTNESPVSGGLLITGNYMSGSGTAAIEIQGASGVTIAANHVNAGPPYINFVLATTAGALSRYLIQAGSVSGSGYTYLFRDGTTGTAYTDTLVSDVVATIGRQTFMGVTFANLGTPSNGTIVYCSDCTIAYPCAGGGTGALAKRLNGAWVCN